MQSALDAVGQMADAELVFGLERLVKADRALCAKLLVHLGEVEARKLYCERAYSSMFEYCRSGLGMSEAEAYLRILAAQVGRRFPLVLERLGAGAVHLTGIKLLAPHLTAENHVQLLDRVRGMTKRQIEVVVADLAPKPDLPARIRKLPERRGVVESKVAAAIPEPTATLSIGTLTGSTPLPAAAHTAMTAPPVASHATPNAPSSAFALQSPRARGACAPLGLGRFKLVVTLGQEAQVALEQLVELFRHQNPSGDLTSIVERALFELRESKLKQRFGQTSASKRRSKSEPATAAANASVEAKTDSEVSSGKSRHIPAAVRRELLARDEGQCTFVSEDGRRCSGRGFIEVHHHHTTFARGGEATAENLRLVCRAHNLFHAERDYGRAYMQEKLREATERKRRSQSLVPEQTGLELTPRTGFDRLVPATVQSRSVSTHRA